MPAPTQHKAREMALALAFEGRWTHAEMAERVGVSTRTIERWVTSPEFKQRIAAARANLAESLSETVYADKLSRITGLSQMAEAARREFEARPWLQEVRPTPNGEIVNESFNRDAHAAFRDALNDIARELGERSNNLNITATQQSLNVTVIMERMQNDPGYAQRANDLARLIAGTGDAGGDHR